MLFARNKKSRARHLEAMAMEKDGRFREAEALYLEALNMDPKRASSLYNLGLLCKYQCRWQESREYNLRVLHLDEEHQAARWNLAIAATAVGDWETARSGWCALGIDVPGVKGPIVMDLGMTPLRLRSGDREEDAWGKRIDPARALITSVTQPLSEFRFGDLVLHDGAPSGFRRREGKILAVFEVLDMLEPSDFVTVEMELVVGDDSDVDMLRRAVTEAGFPIEDWTCEEDLEAGVRRIGLSVRRHDRLDEVITQWQSEGEAGCRRVQDMESWPRDRQKPDLPVIGSTE